MLTEMLHACTDIHEKTTYFLGNVGHFHTNPRRREEEFNQERK
jgi:hypothetical protein